MNEYLIIGTMLNEEGEQVRHASTFLRLVRGVNSTPLIMHLDCHNMRPQSTHRNLFSAAEKVEELKWKEHFEKYLSIVVYGLYTNHNLDNVKHQKRLDRLKRVIEGPTATMTEEDAEDRYATQSLMGKRGRDKSSMRCGGWTRHKQHRPSNQDEDDEEATNQDQTLEYEFGELGKSLSLLT